MSCLLTVPAVALTVVVEPIIVEINYQIQLPGTWVLVAVSSLALGPILEVHIAAIGTITALAALAALYTRYNRQCIVEENAQKELVCRSLIGEFRAMDIPDLVGDPFLVALQEKLDRLRRLVGDEDSKVFSLKEIWAMGVDDRLKSVSKFMKDIVQSLEHRARHFKHKRLVPIEREVYWGLLC